MAMMLPGGRAAGASLEDGGVGERLKGVERALEEGRKRGRTLSRKAAGLSGELRRLRNASVAAAKTVQNHEYEVSRLETELARLARDEAQKSAGIERNRAQFVRVLMGLQKLARNPPEALIARPLTAPDMVRSAILLRAAVPEIERRAGQFRTDLRLLVRTRREAAKSRTRLASALKVMETEQARLNAMIKRKDGIRHRAVAESRAAQRRVNDLARRATDLRELLERLERGRREREKAERQPAAAESKASAEPPPARPISEARGTLPFPATGRLVGLYGQATDTGMTRKGIVIETRREARVVAPYDGRVVFAGKFRGYGQLLIIEHGEGYHSLLAGLGRIDSAIGQPVLAGEPVGLMGMTDGESPALYVELRRNGQPINPLPWLAARKGKVSG